MTSLPAPPPARKARPPVARSIKWLSGPLAAGRRTAAVRIACGPCVTDYHVTELDGGPDGRGFLLVKIPADGGFEEYQTWVGMTNPQDSTCTCLGHCRHGHCKHADGLRALLARADAAERDRWAAEVATAAAAAHDATETAPY